MWRAIEGYVTTVNHDRSSWFRELATRELAAAGVLPGSPSQELVREMAELARVHGVEAVRAKLGELATEAAVAAAAGRVRELAHRNECTVQDHVHRLQEILADEAVSPEELKELRRMLKSFQGCAERSHTIGEVASV